MTMCAALILDDDTILMEQDSEASWHHFLKTNITTKIYEFNSNKNILVGSTGSCGVSNLLVSKLEKKLENIRSAEDLRDKSTEIYHEVRSSALYDKFLQKWNILDEDNEGDLSKLWLIEDGKSLEPDFKADIKFELLEFEYEFLTELIICSILDKPEIVSLDYPGHAQPEILNKQFITAGCGDFLPAYSIGEMIKEKYNFVDKIPIKEGIKLMIDAAVVSESHEAVGGPFDLYVMRRKGIERIDKAKYNMAIDIRKLFGDYDSSVFGKIYTKDSKSSKLRIGEQAIHKCVGYVMDDFISPVEMRYNLMNEYPLGVEFYKKYQNISNKSKEQRDVYSEGKTDSKTP